MIRSLIDQDQDLQEVMHLLGPVILINLNRDYLMT